jgi:NADPH-dependent curcumin reductase CurA
MVRDVAGWLGSGELVADETIVDGGLDRAVDAVLGLLRGENTGKMVVRLQGAPDGPWPRGSRPDHESHRP